MALSSTDKREIETMIRKEIKDFLNSNTLRQFENRIVDRSYTNKVNYRVAIRRNQTVHFEKEAAEQYQLEVQAV